MLDRTEELYDFFSDDDTENDYCFLLCIFLCEDSEFCNETVILGSSLLYLRKTA